MAGGGQGAGVPQGGQTPPSATPGARGIAMQPANQVSQDQWQAMVAAKQGAGQTGMGQTGEHFSFADGGMVQNPYNNFASPNQNFMTYQGQGAPNQPPQLASTQYNGGPDSGTDYAPANLGFDGSGSDGGVGGAPAPMQTPLGSPPSGMTSGLPQAQGNKPLGLAQFQQPQGLQIQGNPSSQVVQRPQQR